MRMASIRSLCVSSLSISATKLRIICRKINKLPLFSHLLLSSPTRFFVLLLWLIVLCINLIQKMTDFAHNEKKCSCGQKWLVKLQKIWSTTSKIHRKFEVGLCILSFSQLFLISLHLGFSYNDYEIFFIILFLLSKIIPTFAAESISIAASWISRKSHTKKLWHVSSVRWRLSTMQRSAWQKNGLAEVSQARLFHYDTSFSWSFYAAIIVENRNPLLEAITEDFEHTAQVLTENKP